MYKSLSSHWNALGLSPLFSKNRSVDCIMTFSKHAYRPVQSCVISLLLSRAYLSSMVDGRWTKKKTIIEENTFLVQCSMASDHGDRKGWLAELTDDARVNEWMNEWAGRCIFNCADKRTWLRNANPSIELFDFIWPCLCTDHLPDKFTI